MSLDLMLHLQRSGLSRGNIREVLEEVLPDILRQALPSVMQSSGGKSSKTVKPEQPKSYQTEVRNFLEEHDKKDRAL